MDLLETAGLSREAGLGYLALGLALTLLTTVRLLLRRSRGERRIQVRLNERE